MVQGVFEKFGDNTYLCWCCYLPHSFSPPPPRRSENKRIGFTKGLVVDVFVVRFVETSNVAAIKKEKKKKKKNKKKSNNRKSRKTKAITSNHKNPIKNIVSKNHYPSVFAAVWKILCDRERE
jgi:hypothetical protein